MEGDLVRNAKSCLAFKATNVHHGILTGSGGGFTQRYTDFIVGELGETSLIHYSIDQAGNVNNIERAPLLLKNRPEEYSRLMQIALDIEFFKIKFDPPPSGIIRHTAVIHPKYGQHYVVWDMNGSPSTPPKSFEMLVKFDREIRHFLTASFKDEFCI